jgi:hypothetical protein
MCSVGGCVKIFGGEAQLRHHYLVDHPDAIFDMDFPIYKEKPEEGKASSDKLIIDKTKFLMDENKRTLKFINEKKKWIRDDVELAKKKYIKRNTLFRKISDDFTEHNDYDEINQRKEGIKDSNKT